MYVIGDLDTAETLHHVTGVMKDLPANTHLPVDMLISFRDNNERSGWAYTYILLEERADIREIEARMPTFVAKHSSEEDAKRDAIIFQPLPRIHLESNLAREIVPNGKSYYVRVVGIAGILILLIAAINFMNLSSAMSIRRAKEIGMRKVMGASGWQLVQFLMIESIINNLIALLIGTGIAYLAFPWFQSFITIDFLPDMSWFAMGMLGVAIVLGLVASIYPVAMLVSLRPSVVLRTTKALAVFGKEGPVSLKRLMLAFQFAISILLIGSAIIAYNQFQFVLHKQLGIEKDQILAIPGVPDAVKDKFETFRNRLAGEPGIAGVSACMEVPSREIRDAGPVLIEGVNSDPAKAPIMDIQVVDHGLVTLLGLRFAAGGNFRHTTDTPIPDFTGSMTLPDYLLGQDREYIINETAMRQLGWKSPEEAIGQRINWSIGNLALAYGPIAGVVRDFHQESLKNKVDPIIMVREPIWLRTFLVKIDGVDTQASVARISNVWNELFPSYPMEYYFLDELYNNLYKGERVQVQLLFLFSGLAILIAFIGLVGLVAYALKTRTKEIAVRKVLGASINDLVRLMSREYVILLLMGALVAIPVSVYGVRKWLSAFAYRVEISPMSYGIALISIAALLVATVGWQTLRAGKSNPADTLREE
jgi:putative ABC transport system permease protein